MESLAKLVLILLVCHTVVGMASAGMILLLTEHFNFWVKNVIIISVPIASWFSLQFPLNTAFIVGYLIPTLFHWWYVS